MSFIYEKEEGKVYEAGWFLVEDEPVTRETRTIPQTGATTAANGSKYVKAGTPFPANGASAVGFVYEDVDVTSGDMAGSVVTKGVIYEDRLPVKLDSAAKTALQGLGFKFVATSPTVTRPY
jgi:hypothetical protein